MSEPVAPGLDLVCRLTVDLADIMEMGDAPCGKRRIIPIIGGTVRGPQLNGEILDIGADWQTVFANGVAKLDTRYAMRTDDGAIIEIRNFGYRFGPEETMQAVARGEAVAFADYTMRTTARLETGDPRYDWVNRTLFVGSGGRLASQVIIDLYAVT